ncbi:MAG: hypothetical protein B7Z02_01065 [Rhodobacterales bacterium 32-67-9]|nr:MAG: hypothetical protein B7Z02_01065 [Rhodobacterales bacterium 32-67-9]
MVERNGAARSRGAEDFARRDALEYWYSQELSPLDDREPGEEPSPYAAEGREMVSGWWILPVLLLAVPAWIGLISLFF